MFKTRETLPLLFAVLAFTGVITAMDLVSRSGAPTMESPASLPSEPPPGCEVIRMGMEAAAVDATSIAGVPRLHRSR